MSLQIDKTVIFIIINANNFIFYASVNITEETKIKK